MIGLSGLFVLLTAVSRGGPASSDQFESHLVISFPSDHVIKHFHMYCV